VFVIAGGGMAGGKAALTLREEGFDGRVVVVGAEPRAPYERPPLSKDYLRGESDADAALVAPLATYEEQGIELRTGTEVVSLDTGAHSVALSGGEELTYDRLLIATGAVPRRPPIEGAERDGVLVLRSMADSDRLRAALERGGPLAIIGGGWIGCEIAASARQLGVEATILEQASQPLEGVLGTELGAFFAGVHREHGVDVRTSVKVTGVEGAGRVERVRLGDGSAVDCDTLLIAVGVAPDTRLAEAAGLELENGIACDERLRTSAPDVFAAGDVASALHPRYGRRVRVEHWANALEQGPAAARSMLDRGGPYDALPYFFTDQYDVGVEYVGLHGPDDRVELSGEPTAAGFQAFWTAPDGRVTAGMHVNDWDAIEPIKERVGAG
jgi:3-phenylpropionate/trans-cinnamate dioxygenase ferredoxin reductase subunit